MFFIISFFATSIGSLAGLGGGIIIKPFLSTFSSLNLININILSSITVLIMALISILKRRKSSPLIENYIFLIFGSILGGILGNKIFHLLNNFIKNLHLIESFQSLLIILILIIVLTLNGNSKSYFLSPSKKNLFLTGFFLAIVSSFLSIGGGPINVSVFIILFSLDIKIASFISLIIIFFSQASSIITYSLSYNITDFNLKPLIFMIPAAILGANLGTYLNQALKEKTINNIFKISLVFLIFLNLFIIIK